MQDFLQLKLGTPLKLTMELVNYDKTIQARLNECIINDLNITLLESWMLKFDCPYFITDEITREQIVNPNYKLIKEEKLIRLKCNNSYAVFVIKEISENTSDNIKSVQCYSADKMISKEVVIEGETIQLNRDELETGEGIFDRMKTSLRGWELRHIDELARVEHDVDIRANKYRYFESIQKKWHEFLREDVVSAFDVLLLFDTFNKRIDCYDRLSYGNDTGWYISNKNITKNISKTSNTKDLITRLYVTGKDDLDISSVNPLGAYVQNYNYFKNDMSDSLKSALIVYEDRMEDIFVTWNNKHVEFMDLQMQYDNLIGQQVAKDTQIKAKRAEQAIVIKDGTAIDISRVKREMDVLQAELTTIVQGINNYKTQLDAKSGELNTISNSMQIENILDINGIKIFSNDNLDELDAYTNESRISNDVYFTEQALYSWAKEQIESMSKPLVEFSVEAQSFVDDVKNYKDYNGIVAIGDWFYIKSDKLGKERVRFTGYSYNPKDKTINMTFTNNDIPQKDNRSFSSVVKKVNGTQKYLNYKKFEWNDASMQKDFVKDLRQSGLNTALAEVFSLSNKNKINIDKSGIWIRNAEDENKVMVITASTIVISDDGLETASTAIDSSGVYAKLLVGEMIVGEKLAISNGNNDFRIDENGIRADVTKLVIRSSFGDNDLKNHISSTIQQSPTDIKIGFNGISDNVVISEAGVTINYGELNAPTITGGTINGDVLNVNSVFNMNSSFGGLFSSEMRFKTNGSNYISVGGHSGSNSLYTNGGLITNGSISCQGNISTINGLGWGSIDCGQLNVNNGIQAGGNNISAGSVSASWLSGSFSSGWDAYGSCQVHSAFYADSIGVFGDFSATGEKNSLQRTDNYGWLGINAYETADYYFGDIGSGTLQNGECLIWIDDIFRETVNTDMDYQVFITKYGKGDIWVEEKHPNYFIVKGDNYIKFGWELKAKRKGYEMNRLERHENIESKMDSTLKIADNELAMVDENAINLEQENINILITE